MSALDEIMSIIGSALIDAVASEKKREGGRGGSCPPLLELSPCLELL